MTSNITNIINICQPDITVLNFACIKLDKYKPKTSWFHLFSFLNRNTLVNHHAETYTTEGEADLRCARLAHLW
jgi:hypothetical protein